MPTLIRLIGQAVLGLVAPAWSADTVWYQIFPERFRNGDPSGGIDGWYLDFAKEVRAFPVAIETQSP